ncbi:MAG: YfhO family protein [Verrucomicrobia bacterium]|nr:YfhO family protein [Verrucomicrobiota bacterium]
MTAPEHARSFRELDAHFTLGRFIALVALFLFLLFPDVILGTRTFVFRDYGLYSYPLAHHLRESLRHGEIPLWNPLSNCGVPFLAQWNPMTLYPPSLFFVLLPLTWGLGMFMLLHLVWAGAGMFVLARRWTGSQIAATFAGLIFVFNGLMTNCLMWPCYVAVLSWAPWVLLTVEHAWREGGKHICIAALAGAMQMLAGVPEVIALTWIIATALLVVDICESSRPRGTLAGRFALVVLLVTALSAAQLFPFLDFLSHSQRDRSYATSDWAMPATGWANLLVPLFRCYESSTGVFFQVNQGVTSSYYLGILSFIFAGIAAWRARERRVRMLAVLALGSLVLALGEHGHVFPALRKIVPQLGVMRYPVKFVFLTMMLVPLLAAAGLNALLTQPAEVQSRSRRTLVAIAGICTLAITALVTVSQIWPGDREVPSAVLKNGILRAVLLALAVTTLFGFLRAATFKRQLVCLLGFVLLTWIDFATHVPMQNPTAEVAVLEPGIPLLQNLRPAPRPGEARAMLTPAAFMEFHQKLLKDPFNTYVLQRVGMYDNCNLLENLAKVDGFWALHLREERAVQAVIFATTNSARPAMAGFLGVAQITSPTNIFEWVARTNFLQLVTGGQKPIFADAATTLNGMAAENFDATKTVFLPLEVKDSVTATNQALACIANYHFSAHHIEADVTADQPALVVVAQTYYHPWRAYVNDQPTPLWRANHAFQSFEVPKGESHVRLVYEDHAFRIGAALSFASVALCCFVLARKPNQPVKDGGVNPIPS